MKRCNYHYLIKDLSEGKTPAYVAIIPKFPNIHVMADSVEELHEGVIETIEIDIKKRKKERQPIPTPDKKTNSTFKGKIIIRTTPELHEKLFLEAQAHQISLNKYIESKLA